MEIHLTSGTGTAPTSLAAFDKALQHAGIANFNLVYLSSVIPPDSKLVRDHHPLPTFGLWGDRLYVVIAQQSVSEIGSEAWAGIGWVQDQFSGRGLFVEHQGSSRQFVEMQIEASLRSMVSSRRSDWSSPDALVVGTRCVGDPTCAVAVAVYRAEPWTGSEEA